MSSLTTSAAVPAPHSVRVVVTDDLRRNRLTVAFRLVLALPHLLLVVLWSVAAVPAVALAWLTALAARRPAEALSRFLAAYVRYFTRVNAYVAVFADPYPWVSGDARYPVDVEVDAPDEQSRWHVAFRLALALPALLILNALQSVLQIVAILGWFYALATGRMHPGLHAVGVYCLRYQAQTVAYVGVLTARYPSLSGIA